MSTTWRSRSGTATATAKGKKRMLGFMTDILKSNKRPEISTPHDPHHVTHVGFDSSTREFTGLPKNWQRLLEDSGTSKFAQEKDPLDVMEVIKFSQEGRDNAWDRMGHVSAPGSSRSAPTRGAVHATFPVVSKSVDDSLFPTVSPLL
jgi:p21-activated kinase 1